MSYIRDHPSYPFNRTTFLVETTILAGASLLVVPLQYLYMGTIPDTVFIFSILCLWAVPSIIFSSITTYTNDISEPEFSPSIPRILIWLVTNTLVITGLLYISLGTNIFTIPVEYYILYGLPFVYTIRLFTFYKLYTIPNELYTDQHSVASTEWLMASVTLNQAVSIWESGRRIHAFPGLFWTILSIGRYQDVMDVIESKEHREYLGARAYLKACKFLYKAFYLQFIFPSKAKQNIEQVKEYISNAHQILSTRKCESCGEVHNISTMFRVIDNTDTERIYCTNCYTPGGVICPNCGRSVPSDTVRNGHCNHCRETTQHSQQSQKQKKRTTQETGTKKSAEPELEQYCSVLDIEQPLTEDKIKSAYRDKSKAVHPDVDGGSEEKFKEVKTAKDQLLKLIN